MRAARRGIFCFRKKLPQAHRQQEHPKEPPQQGDLQRRGHEGRQHAGRLLAFMKRRKDAEGGYRYLPAAFRQVACPDLLYGAAGMGYELIRYAYPSMLHQILF